jgi:plastocyanin
MTAEITMTARMWRVAIFMMSGVPIAFLAGCSQGPRGDVAGADPGTGVMQQAAPAAPTVLSQPEPNQVIIDNYVYTPAELTVAPGTKVTWINRDDAPHTVTSTAKPRQFHSGTLDSDGRFSHVFTTPGTYEYYCTLHAHMIARVIVK